MEESSLFDRIIGHAKAKRILDVALKSPQNGYLLTGPDGVGVHPFAEAFVRRLADEYKDGSLAGHPDILVLEREPSEKGSGLKKEIAVQAVRELKVRVSERPTIASRLVIYIPDADYLNEEGVNALLKCIEEPSVKAVYVFAAHAVGKLPATLLSRLCQIRLDRVSESEIVSWLVAKGIDTTQAKRIALTCDGKPGYAHRYLEDSEYRAYLEEIDVSMERLIRAMSEGEALASIASIASSCDSSDDPVTEWRNAIQLWQSSLRRMTNVSPQRKHLIGRALIATERSLGSSIPPRLWLELGLVHGFQHPNMPSFQIPKPFPFIPDLS